MDNNLSFKRILKYFKLVSLKYSIALLCLSGLLYQAHLLLEEYKSGKTVVSIQMGNFETDSLPAFTICLPFYFSIERVAKNYPELSQLYLEYSDNLKKFAAGTYGYPLPNDETKNSLRSMYFRIEQLSMIRSLSAHIILENYSIPMHGSNIKILGYINETAGNKFYVSAGDTRIIESLSFQNSGEFWKCFTFLSHLSKLSRKFQMILQVMTVQLLQSYEWFPLFMLERFYFAMHSQNSLPDMGEENRITLIPNKVNWIKFNQITTELLGSGYDTNCFGYDLDYKFANFNMRSDCVMSCVEDILVDHCGTFGFTPSGYMLRSQLLEQEQNRKIPFGRLSNCHFESKTQVLLVCKNKCRPDCLFRYYPLEYELEEPFINSWNKSDTIIINIKHNSLPDILIKHLPQTTFLSLVCNFGGLLGMWLGLSALDISENLLVILNKSGRKLIINYFPSANFNLFVKQPKISKRDPWSNHIFPADAESGQQIS